jgi:predicted lipoprotein with Yx(FWY)xxD motif
VLVPAGATTPIGGPGIKGHVGEIKRPEGTMQLTYNGYPVYRYAMDSAAGDMKGEGVESFGGYWFLMSANATTGAATAVKPS